MANSYDIPIGTTGKCVVRVLQPPNNGVIYTVGVWDKPSASWQFGPESGVVMPGDPDPDEFDLGPVTALDDDYFCISAKLIPFDGAVEKYWVVFEVKTNAGTSTYRSKEYTSPQQVDLVYQFTN